MKKNTLYLTRGALIASIYFVMTMISAAFGLHNSIIQVRLSEMLCILPIFFPEAVIGLTVGCLISNLISGSVLDITFGTIATLIGAVGARLLSKLPPKLIWIATVPTILANTIIIPVVLIYSYGAAPASYPYFLLTVGVGELISAGILGSGLYYTMRKYKK